MRSSSEKITGKGSYIFLNTLNRQNSLIMKRIPGSFIMLNAKMKNEHKRFANFFIFLLRL